MPELVDPEPTAVRGGFREFEINDPLDSQLLYLSGTHRFAHANPRMRNAERNTQPVPK